jgi:hypothetical protein
MPFRGGCEVEGEEPTNSALWREGQDVGCSAPLSSRLSSNRDGGPAADHIASNGLACKLPRSGPGGGSSPGFVVVFGDARYCFNRRSESAIAIICFVLTDCESVLEIQYTARLVFHATSRKRRPS